MHANRKSRNPRSQQKDYASGRRGPHTHGEPAPTCAAAARAVSASIPSVVLGRQGAHFSCILLLEKDTG
jgi:hypothetical protein